MSRSRTPRVVYLLVILLVAYFFPSIQRKSVLLMVLGQATAGSTEKSKLAYTRVYAWGDNRYGEAGIGNFPGQSFLPKPAQCSPQPLEALNWENVPKSAPMRGPERIIAGVDHSLAIARDGSLHVWGRNREGQLGLGAEDSETNLETLGGAEPPPPQAPDAPPAAPPPPEKGLIASFEPRRVVVRDKDGTPQPIVDACLGLASTTVVTGAGKVYTWGSNRFGQLGLGDRTVIYTDVPRLVEGPLRGLTIVNVTCGPAHVVALSTEGILAVWGANNEGQLGLGYDCLRPFGEGLDPCLGPRFEPYLVTQNADGNRLPPMKMVSACGHVGGGMRSLLQKSPPPPPPPNPPPPANEFAEQVDAPPPGPGDLLVGSNVTEDEEVVDPAENLGLESAFTVAVDTSNQLWAFGDNYYGQLGIGQEYVRVAHNTETYTRNRFDNVTGKYYNRQVMPVLIGMLGEGTIGEELQPDGSVAVKVTAFPVRNMACGSHHVVVLLNRGEIYAWGDNMQGQLGMGFETTNRETNTRVPTYTPKRVDHFDFYEVQSITQLDENQNVITKVERTLIKGRLKGPPRQRFIKVAAANFATMALTDAGSVYTWGTNSHGEQGTCGCGFCPVHSPKDFKCPRAPPAPPLRAASSAYTFPPMPPLSPRVECTCECMGNTRGCVATGFCNGWANESFCDCGQSGPGVFQGGNKTYERAAKYPSGALADNTGLYEAHAPMQLEFHSQNNHTVTDIAVGGALFLQTSKPCPEDADGMICSRNGECDEATGTCKCKRTFLGRRCQYKCPVAEEEEARLQDNDIEGLVCSGHGVCTPNATLGTAVCTCDDNWFGDKCHLECLKDLDGRYCSGNGTCAYDPNIDAVPYCKCRYHNTRQTRWDAEKGKVVLDEEANEAAKELCAAEKALSEKPGLQIRPDGYCAYHGTKGTPYFSGKKQLVSGHDGYSMCVESGLCGICESAATRRFLSLGYMVSLVLFVYVYVYV